MSDTESIWFRLGYALEKARQEPPARLRGIGERQDAGRRSASKDAPRNDGRQREGDSDRGREDALDALLTTGAGALAAQLLGLLPARRRPGPLSLLRAGAAGAGAALLRELVDPLLHGRLRIPRLGPEVGEALLAGAARGLLYASLLEPRLPGPALARGVLYGSAEYAVSPWGGLPRILGDRAPHKRIPFMSGLFEDYALGEDTWSDHLVFGLALAILYGSEPARARSGIAEET